MKRKVKVKVTQLCPTLWPHQLQPARLFCPWNYPGQNTGMGSCSFLQGIFPSQGSNSGLLHCRQMPYHLSHQTSWLWNASVQSLSCVWLFATPFTTAHQASLSITTNSQHLSKLMSIELMMASNHLILCHHLILLPSIFPSVRIFSNGSASSHHVAEVLEFQLQHQSFQWTLRTDLF